MRSRNRNTARWNLNWGDLMYEWPKNYECDGQMSLFDIAPEHKSYFETAVMDGSGFGNGKKRIYEFFRGDHTREERVRMIKSEYGEGGCGWKQDVCGLCGFSYGSKGIRIDYYDNEMTEQHENHEWGEVEKEISALIKQNKYYIPKFDQCMNPPEEDRHEGVQSNTQDRKSATQYTGKGTEQIAGDRSSTEVG